MSSVSIIILSGGKRISEEYQLVYAEVKTEFNRIPYAELGFADGSAARQEYPLSESPDFELGKEVEIKMGYINASPGNAPQTVFKGIVMKQSLQLTASGTLLVVELNDAAVKMTATKKSAVFTKMKDSDIIRQLVQSNGLQNAVVDNTTTQHLEMVQYAATDWDFMLCRAEANGLLVSVKAGAIAVQNPSLSALASLKRYEVGTSEIYDFNLEADGRHQLAAATAASWDVKKQQLTSPQRAGKFNLAQGNFQPADVAKKLQGNNEALITAVGIAEGEAKAWADAKMIKSRLSFLKGRFKVPGDATVAVDNLVEINGVGKRFNGITLISGVRQYCDAGGWVTDIQFGLTHECFAAKPDVSAMPAAGLLPAINGLHVGVVQHWEEDPGKEHRVQVKVPALTASSGVLWARLATLSAGNKAGTFFQPEPGDEVILGFLNDDPRQPVILGSVHNPVNKPPLTRADKNPEKGIVTKSGIKILLNDEKKLLTIATSDNNTITINDKDKTIEIKDTNNNSIKLGADGITLDSGKDVIIKAKGEIKME